jgi:small-conductance mechanosensitive channel
VFVQDIRFRAVSWLFFPVLALLYVIHGLVSGLYLKEVLFNTALNVAFLLVVFIMVWLYISLRKRRFVHLPDKFIGWGDILFLLCICFYFTLLNFILFYVVSLLVIVVLWLIWITIRPRVADRHVPLAGLQALILSVVLMIDWSTKSIDLTNDNWLLFLIGR